MRKKSSYARRRGRRAGVFASLAATAAMMVASIGAAPAQGATNTAWIPLFCSIGGVVPVHVGAALTTTTPDSVAPAGTFNLTDTSTTVIFPPAAQQGGAVFMGDAVQGIVQNFQTNLTGASVDFDPTPVGPTQTSATQFNAVRAVQPPNQAATGNARINGGDTTRFGFQPATPPESFSFGDIPTDSSGQTGNRFGPVPGIGGGPNPTDGTPDTLPDIGPITVTGAAGTDVVIVNQNPGGPDVVGLPAPNPVVADNTISFHENTAVPPPDASDYGPQLAADCAFDTSEDAVAKPVETWVDEIRIPIEGVVPVDGEGSASARGTDPDANIVGTPGAASYSAIVNCDEAQSTRPFYVQWGEQQFKKDAGAATESTCVTEGGTKVAEGSATGLVNGATPATVEWSFVDGVPTPDNVNITVTVGANVIDIAGAPEALNGTPGGVWATETTPWPAGGGV